MSAAGDEKLGYLAHVLAWLREKRAPPDHVTGMVGAEAVHITTRVQEGAHHAEIAACRGPMQWIGIVAFLTRIGIGALREQQVDNLRRSVSRRFVQCGPAA